MKMFESPIEQILMYDMYAGRKSYINPYIYSTYQEFDKNTSNGKFLDATSNICKRKVRSIMRSKRSFK